MTVGKSTRRVYSAEELYRLRGTCSQPKLREAIEEHDGEDAELVKEHVLRGSKSFAARSFRSRVSGNSLRVPSQKENRSTTDAENGRQSISEEVSSRIPILGEIPPNNQVLRPGGWRLRPSPTPTLTKKAAEAIVKAHGSPQHVRVTAGGRIVPSEQSPLCHPRYGYSAIKTNGGLVKFAPNHPIGQKQQWTQATQNGFVAQDVEGRLCQIVNGTILPLNEVDGALRLYMPAPNLNINGSRNSSFGSLAQTRFSQNINEQREVSQGTRIPPTEPSSAAQANALELEYSKLEHELRELGKTEVLHGRTMGKAAKDALVNKRRELVVSMDNIRKAIKGLKNSPPPDALTSPRTMLPNRQSVSPAGRDRLPPFLQHRLNETAMPSMPAFSNFFASLPGQQQNGQFAFHSTPSPDAPFASQSFGMPPSGVFVPPPPFDGSMSQSFAPFSEQGVHTVPRAAVPASNAASNEAPIPQTDGAWTLSDRRNVASPRVSRAIDIKAPEPKQATSLKSTLNPMSPAYKPGAGLLQSNKRSTAKSVKDTAPAPLSPLHQLRAPAAVTVKNPHSTDDTISPSKNVPHLHSSSISSFQTADFFPRNTREYSIRKDAYPDSGRKSEDKENTDPLRNPATPDEKDSGYNASDPAKGASTPGFYGAVAPPASPVAGQIRNESLPFSINLGAIPDRQVDNLSPKDRCQNWAFIREHPSQASSSDNKFQSARQELCVTVSPENLDFSEASVEWLEGYRAGLSRKTVGADKSADFMDGYCAGVLKAKSKASHPSTGSPSRNASRRPSPATLSVCTSSQQKLERREPTPVRPMLENAIQSMDTLKEAMFAPNNESALLTPAPDGPHINDASFNLGAWAKHNGGDGLAGFPFPHRTASVAIHRGTASIRESGAQQKCDAANTVGHTQQSRDLSSTNASMKSGHMNAPSNDDNRVSSMTSIDSNLYRQYPGHRVFSPHLEWRSASSVAQAAGLTTGCFTNAQFDGSNRSLREQAPSVAIVASQQQRLTSIGSNPAMRTHSRFREGSLDGLSDPAIASPPLSPQLPPKDHVSPTKIKKNSSPVKSASPAKAKSENIAEKVGIKMSKDNGSPTSPNGKRRWRDVWRGGKKEGSRDEVA